jgi:hypothetical protein
MPRPPLRIAVAPFLGLALAACNGAGGQLAAQAASVAMQLAGSAASKGGGGERQPECPASCGTGNVCDPESGRCISEKLAAALARARKERAEHVFEVPADPCGNRCKEGERCESRGSAAKCVADPLVDQ